MKRLTTLMPSSTFILKVSADCNLNCTYCYVYNLGDLSFEGRPRAMQRDVAVAAVQRILDYADRNALRCIRLCLHGGEPLLAGKGWMRWFLDTLDQMTPGEVDIALSVQTNGTLVDREWLDIFRAHNCSIGISLDGPEEWHDRQRTNRAGKGTYRLVRRAVDLLVGAGTTAPPWGVLAVANPAYSGVEIYEHFVRIGIKSMDFLWPDHHHDLAPPWPSGLLSQYYRDLFDRWYVPDRAEVRIRWFLAVIAMLRGAQPSLDCLGPQAVSEVVIETDGSLEPLDVLRICGEGKTRLGLSVLNNTIEDLRATSLFQLGLHNQEQLPQECRECSVFTVCGGGYLPHRWRQANGFRNPSVYSAELREVITHIGRRLEVPAHAPAQPESG